MLLRAVEERLFVCDLCAASGRLVLISKQVSEGAHTERESNEESRLCVSVKDQISQILKTTRIKGQKDLV